MDLAGKSKAELADLLVTLASNLKEEDLNDPETVGLVSQLLDVLDPKPQPLPPEIVSQIKDLAKPEERFMTAAQMLGVTGPEDLKRLADSMKAEGLLKTEDLDCDLTKALLQDIQNSHILMFPVTIRGREKPTNNEVHQYHITLKWLHPDGPKNELIHKPEEIQDLVNRYQLHPPDVSKLEPHVFDTRFGPMHVLKIPNTPALRNAHDELSIHNPSRFEFTPHISVEQHIHDKIKEGSLKPEDLRIQVHPLEYRIGNKTVHKFIPAPQATAHFPPIGNMKKSIKEHLKSIGREDLAQRLEKAESNLEKGQDEKGNPIRGSNKRLQQAKVFGTKSDVKTDKKGVQHPKIPDANGKRTSDQRMKMMNTIKDFAQKRYNSELTVAQGKRDDSGKLKNEVGIDKEPFDVFTKEGHKQEKARDAKIKEMNAANPDKKPVKRTDPKPDWRSGKLETQPSPDAAIHELAHIEVDAKPGASLPQIQTDMDKRWGDSQSKYGHMQQKKTAGEIQPMAAENKLRREMGLPANRGSKKTDTSKPVEQAIDGSGPRFNRAKDSKGNAVDLDRQSRLLHPENQQKIHESQTGQRKFTPEKGWHENNSPDAKINRRADQKKEAPQATQAVEPKKKPEKLAASEWAPGMSYNDMKKKEGK